MPVGDQSVQEFKTKFSGELLRPGDENYDAARRIWNGKIDKKPALIAHCTGVADVLAAVEFARSNNLRAANLLIGGRWVEAALTHILEINSHS
jgi:hypothetical protein